MIDIKKGRYYKDRHNRLAHVVSEKIIPLDVYAVLYSPAEPNFHNLFFVKKDGSIDELDTDPMDLVIDVTCPHCDGRGHYITRIGPDDYRRRSCEKCGSKGYKLSK